MCWPAPRARPRYGWTGAHETDRNFAAGRGSGTTVVGKAKHAGPPAGRLNGTPRLRLIR
jgi:hypothetical protein